jgi:hypothetical protein
MTVYYSPSGDTASDEESVENKVKAAVKSGMDTNVAVTDTTKAVYYIGDRDNFSFTKSMFMLNGESKPAFRDRGGAKLAVGLSSAVFAALLVVLCCRMRRSRSKSEDLTVLDVEIGNEITTQKSFRSKKVKKTKQETEVEDYIDDSATNKFGITCCWK